MLISLSEKEKIFSPQKKLRNITFYFPFAKFSLKGALLTSRKITFIDSDARHMSTP